MQQGPMLSEEQALMAAYAEQLSREFDDRYFLTETKEKRYPHAFREQLTGGGYLGIMVDESDGGAGMSSADLGVFLTHMAKAGLGSLQLVNQLLCSDIVSSLGTRAQKELHLPDIIQGAFWCYADLEETTGQSLFAIETTARLEGDAYVLDGAKSYAVCASMASHLIVAARTPEPGGQREEGCPGDGISLFIVDAKTPGIETSSEHLNVRVTDKREEMAATGDLFDTVTFASVKVPASGLIGEAGGGGALITRIAARQMLMLALLDIGWGERCIDKTVLWANERVIFEDPISSYQAVQHPMVLARTEIEMAKLLAERAAEAFDASEDDEALLTWCSIAKARASDAAYKSFDIAMQTHGGAGYDRDTGIISLWPLVLMSRLTPLSNARILERFAEKALGAPNAEGSTGDVQDLTFETRTDREVTLIGIALDAMSSGVASGGAMDMMGRVMGGDLAEYRDLILPEQQGVLPVKLDIIRQFAVYTGGSAPGTANVATSLVKTSPVKFGLSAMAMAAVSKGPGGTEKIMNEYLPNMMEGRLFCYCITEPGAGTNTHNVSTIAVDEGDHYRLNGQKTFISAADTAYYMAVVARVELDGVPGAVGTFVMEADTKGISMTELDIAALGDPQFTIHFDDVILPKDALVGGKASSDDKNREGTAAKTGTRNDSRSDGGISEGVFYTLNLERIMVSLLAMSVGRDGLTRAVAKALEVPRFGPLAGASDAVKQRLAGLKLDLELTNLALKKSTVAFDSGAPGKHVGMYANMAKYISSMFADEAADLALELYGVAGLDKNLDDIGALRQVGRVLRTVPINNEMVLNFLAENLLELPKSYRTGRE